MKSAALTVALWIFTMNFAGMLHAEAPTSESKVGSPVSFRNDVAPILLRRCLSCHGPRRQEGEYEVTNYDMILDAVTPGNARRSSLYRLLIRKDLRRRMPKDKDPLPDQEIETIRLWVEEGARLDAGDPKAPIRKIVPRPRHRAPPPRYDLPLPVTAMAFSPDGKALATSGYHEVQIWDVESGKILRRIDNIAERTYGLEFHPSGRLLAVACGTPAEYGEVLLVDPATGDIVKQLATLADVAFGVTFSPDGSRLATTAADASIRIFAVNDGPGAVEELFLPDHHSDWVLNVAWNSDGSRLVSASRDKTAKTFDGKTGEVQSTYVGHQKPVYGVAFSSDGSLVYTAGADNKIHYWKSAPSLDTAMSEKGADPKIVHSIGGYSKPIYGLTFGNDFLFSFAADRQVKLHRASDRALLRSFAGHRERVYAMAYHVESKRLATGDFAGEVKIWNVDNSKAFQSFFAAPGFPPTDPANWRRADL